MKKLLVIIALVLIAMPAFMLVPTANAAYNNLPAGNEQFHPRHPDYYDGNLRSKLKKRADIERASKSNLHYDERSRDYYRCDWKYNKNLGSWACGKDYVSSKPQAITACPFGYTKHSIQNTCVAVRVPAHAHLNSQGNAWQCDNGYQMNYPRTGCDRNYAQYTAKSEPQYEITRYIHYYGEDGPTQLPQTGPGLTLALLISGLVSYRFIRRRG